MSEHRPEFIDLCAGWALGSLDENDRRRFEEHLAGRCSECEAALADFSAATVALAASLPAAPPSPRLRERVLAAVATGRSASGDGAAERRPRPGPADGRSRVMELKPRTFPLALGWVTVAAAAALVVASLFLWSDVRRLQSELDARRGQLAELEQKLADVQRWNEVLAAPGARVAVLEPTSAGSAELRARVTYDPATRRAVVVFDNLKPPVGRDYELWAIRGEIPASLGVIKADPAGRAVLRLENVGDPSSLAAFAVSLEPEGGSPTPTAPSGPVVMLGKM